MNIGAMRHRAALYHVQETDDAYGEDIRTWDAAAYTTVWARVEPLSGRELEHAKQVSADTTHRITMRYNSAVTAEDRIVYDSRTFEITSLINPDEKNRELILMCKEVL